MLANLPRPPPPKKKVGKKFSLNGDFFTGYNSESKRLGNHLHLQDPPPVGMVSQVSPVMRFDGFPYLLWFCLQMNHWLVQSFKIRVTEECISSGNVEPYTYTSFRWKGLTFFSVFKSLFSVKRAKGLKIKGKNGSNDPFVTIGLGKEKFQTSVVEKSAESVEWMEECELCGDLQSEI